VRIMGWIVGWNFGSWPLSALECGGQGRS
jgi:hypothetical protein